MILSTNERVYFRYLCGSKPFFCMFRSILLFSFLVPSFVSAQLVSSPSLIWTRYMVQTVGHPKHFFIAEIDNRIQSLTNIGRRNQTISHAHFHYKIKESLDIALGTTFSNVARYSSNEEKRVVNEFRIFEELNFRHLQKRNVAIQSRIRIEQRYFPTETKAGTNEQLPIQSRLRYQLQFSQKFGKRSLLKVSDEIMFHAGGWVDHLRMDQNRVYLAARTQFTPSLALEAGYLWIINQGIETTSPVRETDVLRFTLHHSLASKKK